MPRVSIPSEYRSHFSATVCKAFELPKKKLHGSEQQKNVHVDREATTLGLKEWWATFRSSIHIPRKLAASASVADVTKAKRGMRNAVGPQPTTTLKPILKKRAAVFPSDFEIPTASELYYASQLSMPKLTNMPWVHSYPAPVGYYSMDNFHMREYMYGSRPSISSRQSSLAWNEEVEIIPALSGSKYNRKPLANATYMNLTPDIKSAIRDELNYYKMNEMVVHELSMSHTVFH